MMQQHAHAKHGIVDKLGRLAALDEVLGAPERALVQPDVRVDGETGVSLASGSVGRRAHARLSSKV
jgi:hypothetical protein